MVPKDDFRIRSFFFAFQAIAATISENETRRFLQEMRRAISKRESTSQGWSFDEIEQWLSKSDLPDAKESAVNSILLELKGLKP